METALVKLDSSIANLAMHYSTVQRLVCQQQQTTIKLTSVLTVIFVMQGHSPPQVAVRVLLITSAKPVYPQFVQMVSMPKRLGHWIPLSASIVHQESTVPTTLRES